MKDLQTIGNAFTANCLLYHRDKLESDFIKHLVKTAKYILLPDRLLTDNEDVREHVVWERVDKMQLIRIFIRCIDQDIDILDKIKPAFSKHNYRIKNIIKLLGRKPHYIEFFPIDLNKLKTFEASSVLAIGDVYFLDKIDFGKYRFNFKESMNIIAGYVYDREIIKKVNYKSLKGYQIAEILIHTGEENLDLLDLSKLTNIDWLDLLEKRPEMLKYCDYNKFNNGDIFYSIKLCCMFDEPDLSYLVLDRSLDEVSPFGWEKLLIEKPEIFLAHCNFSKLDDGNWNNILKDQPSLHVYRVN